ncbi:MAG: hypothetical protein QGH33_11740 [Pirellulaceae bacterium]|nr:hypothetical protein [Pirellulaceae bacterium]HJN08126.1 hypothetical protein [Pirellulaceae bacterium]
MKTSQVIQRERVAIGTTKGAKLQADVAKALDTTVTLGHNVQHIREM